METVHAYENQLGAYLHASLAAIDGVRIYGPAPSTNCGRAALCAFNVDGVHASDLATFLDHEGIAIRVKGDAPPSAPNLINLQDPPPFYSKELAS